MPSYLPSTIEFDRTIPDVAPYSQGMDETAAEALEAASVAYAQDIFTVTAASAAGRVVNVTATFDGGPAFSAGVVQIAWGDGSEGVASANPAPHTYSLVGSYGVRVRFVRPGQASLERTFFVTAIT